MILRLREYFKLFGKGELSEFLRLRQAEARREIEQETEQHLNEADEEIYINHLVEKYSYAVPVFDFDGFHQLPSYEKHIKGAFQVSQRTGHINDRVLRDTYVFAVPFTGDGILLNFKARYSVFTPGADFFFLNNSLCFEVENSWGADRGDQVESTALHLVDGLKRQMPYFTEQVEAFHSDLRVNINNAFKNRKTRISRRNEVAQSLSIPIKKRENISQTYDIPTPEIRKKLEFKPELNRHGWVAEPTLGQSVYEDILHTINSVGKVFERYPSIYRGKGEEPLRDLLILYLDPRYYYAGVTAETFNSVGKTDIRIAYEGSYAFIAECKFWTGEKGYLDTITQLLKYLTWRDSKAAIVIFVNRKEIVTVLSSIKDASPKHSNYLSSVDQKEESWFNYTFHLDGDKSREVKLAVLVFHVPDKRGG
jgi:hypothetical protein